jgi:hypothetical protein
MFEKYKSWIAVFEIQHLSILRDLAGSRAVYLYHDPLVSTMLIQSPLTSSLPCSNPRLVSFLPNIDVL